MSHRAYPYYKDTEAAWLGQMPHHWELRRARQLGNFTASGIDKKDVVGEVPVKMINYTDVYKSKTKSLQFNDGLMNTTAAAAKVAEHSLREGDILLTPSSETADDIGHAALVTAMPDGVVYSYHILRFRSLSGIVPKFLTYCFNAAPTRAYFSSVCTGTTRMVLGRDDFKNAPIPMPPMGEQSAIAHFLDRETDKIDNLIDKQEQLIKLLEEKRHAVISHAVTKGLNPDVRMKDSGVEWLGEVPEHWRRTKFCWLYHCSKRQNHPDCEVLSVYRDYGVVLKSDRDDNANKTPEDLSTYQLVNIGDLVVNKMKAWQGSLGVSPYLGITSPDYVVYSPLHSESHQFIHHLLRAKHMAGVYLSISNGIRPSQWRIEPEKLQQLPIYLPPLDEQEAIVGSLSKEVSRVATLIDCSQEAIGFLRERRTALISAAVTGKIDVRGVA